MIQNKQVPLNVILFSRAQLKPIPTNVKQYLRLAQALQRSGVGIDKLADLGKPRILSDAAYMSCKNSCFLLLANISYFKSIYKCLQA